jgi:osmoprotectant transport system permease protein
VIEATLRHLQIAGIALVIGLIVCVPLGVLTSRSRLAATTIINGFNAIRVVPSIAILFMMLPLTGLSSLSAVIALTILALPPILINTDAAFRAIDPAVREAATGMGMSAAQTLRRVEFPLALPVLIAGVRIAAVEVIASATLAAFVGGGGLGDFIVLGFALNNPSRLLVGAIPVALLALLAEVGMGLLGRVVAPPVR